MFLIILSLLLLLCFESDYFDMRLIVQLLLMFNQSVGQIKLSSHGWDYCVMIVFVKEYELKCRPCRAE